MKTIFRLLGQMIAQLIIFLLVFVMLSWIVVFARNSMSAATKVHWLAEVTLGLIWIGGAIGVLAVTWYAMSPSSPRWLQDYMLLHKRTNASTGLLEQYSVASLSAMMCVAILTAISALTGVSAVLASRGLLTYTIENSPEQPLTELLFRLYMWHTIDVIPIDIWKAYDITPPIRPEGFWAPSIVLALRTAIAGFAISVIAQLIKFKPKMPGRNKNARHRWRRFGSRHHK